MANLLAKDPIVTVIPGTPAVPAIPSMTSTQTYMRMYSLTFSGGVYGSVLTPDWAAFLSRYHLDYDIHNGAGRLAWLLPGHVYQAFNNADNSPAVGITVVPTGNGGVVIYTTTTTLSTAVAAVPDTITTNPNPGWNASAVSIASVSATGRPYYVSFKMPDTNVGSIAGVVDANHGEVMPRAGFAMNKGVLTLLGSATPITHTNNAVLKIIVYPLLGVTEWWVGALLVSRSVPLAPVGTQPLTSTTLGAAAPVSAYGQANAALGAQLYLAGDNVTDPAIDYSTAVSVVLTLEPLGLYAGIAQSTASLTLRPLQMLAFASGPMLMRPLTLVSGLTPPQGSSLTLEPAQMLALASVAPFVPVMSGAVLGMRALTLRCGAIAPLQLRPLKVVAGRIWSASDITMEAPQLAISMFTEDNTTASMFEIVVQSDPWTTSSIFAVVFNENLGLAVALSAVTVKDAAMASSLLITSPQTLSEVLNALMTSTVLVPFDVAEFTQGSVVWVVNAGTGASSTYTGYAFNSFMKIAGAHYGAQADGIYSLDEADDTVPMVGRLNFGNLTFGSTVKNRVSEAYLGLSSSGNLFLKVTVDGTEYTYRTDRSNVNLATQRVKLGRGIEANALGFELYNDTGADFELETVEFNRVPLSRRI